MIITPEPFKYRYLVGVADNYFIHKGYQARTEVPDFDDTPFTDEFQLPVYQYAEQLASSHHYYYILDLGCGSGFKLVTVFHNYETLGIDRKPTIDYCRRRWKGRDWVECGVPITFYPDLLICSDVIEHLLNPNELMETITLLKPKRIVLSTPAREALAHGTHDGPPKNAHHVREWSVAEFHNYCEAWLNIVEHFQIGGIQIVEATCK